MMRVDDSGSTDAPGRHPLATRLFHAALAVTIVTQLLTSLVMRLPFRGRPANVFFTIHQYSGYAALVLAFLFWVNILRRRRGTAPGALMPWFSVAGLRALQDDIRLHLAFLRRLRLPPHEGSAPLASAIHGLGLALMTTLAVTGAFGVLMLNAGYRGSALVWADLQVHGALGNLAWAYLFGHVGLVLIQHLSRNMPLGVMWSFRADGPHADAPHAGAPRTDEREPGARPVAVPVEDAARADRPRRRA